MPNIYSVEIVWWGGEVFRGEVKAPTAWAAMRQAARNFVEGGHVARFYGDRPFQSNGIKDRTARKKG